MSRLNTIKEILEDHESDIEDEISGIKGKINDLKKRLEDNERLFYQVRELLEATVNQINSEYRKNKEAEFIIQQQKQLIDQLHITLFNSQKGSYQ